jgi:hypothetical protein
MNRLCLFPACPVAHFVVVVDVVVFITLKCENVLEGALACLQLFLAALQRNASVDYQFRDFSSHLESGTDKFSDCEQVS